MSKQGICYLVGAGPGDPGLVTFKAKECIETCDVLVYDALSSAELVGWTKKGCELIFETSPHLAGRDHSTSRQRRVDGRPDRSVPAAGW